MSAPLRIAIAGLGTVGAETVRLIREQGALIAARCGRPIEIVAVSARDRAKARPVDLAGLSWFDDPAAMATEPGIDAVVELIGGSDGIAKATVVAALGAGRHVVTANKALIAHHGTCNYILTTMRETGRDFDAVLAEAQELGYAEADPGFDIDGVDTAHKLAILTALAFGCEIDFANVHIEGIRAVSALDIAYAEELGYRIKLLGIATRRPDGVEQRVHPCMVAKDSPIAAVEGGWRGICVGSGLGAINAAILAFVKSGDHVLMVDTVYGPARRFCDHSCCVEPSATGRSLP